MSDAPVEGQPISRTWAFSAMLISMAVAIGMNETVAYGHGKAIFFALFMMAFITKITQKVIHETRVIVFLFLAALFHAALIFIVPTDSHYPGGLLFPAGILDLIILYFIFQRVARGL